MDRSRPQKVGNKNFFELSEHVLIQCKETKNLEKKLDKMLTRITSLEKNINNLMELKNTAPELRKAYTSFNSQINQAEERLSQTEDKLNEIKSEGNIGEKRKETNKASKKYGIIGKDLIYT